MTSTIQKSAYSGPILPKHPIRSLVLLKRNFKICVWRAVARVTCTSGFLASLYYTFLSTQFYREHKAVLQGRLAHANADAERQKSSARLRRNIHQLEKGLIMRPRRPVFAEQSVLETVELFQKSIRGGAACPEESKWAKDVLVRYFSVVGDSEVTIKARNSFETTNSAVSDEPYVPYRHETLEASGIRFEDLMVLLRERRSVRWYNGRHVEAAKIEQAVEAATLAPSACNRQPFSFLVIRDGKRAGEIASFAAGTGGFAQNLPCLIVVVGDLSCYADERDRHLIYIDASLAGMQLMLALQTLGLASCPINWPDIEKRERKMQRELRLRNHERAIMLIGVGYADPTGEIPFSQKKTRGVLIRNLG